MHVICCHASVFLIRPTPTQNNTLQIILKISIFRFGDPINEQLHDLHSGGRGFENPGSEQIFFEHQYVLQTRFLEFSFDKTVTSHSKHASKRDLSEIKRTSSGNSNMLIANGYLLLFMLYSALKALV